MNAGCPPSAEEVARLLGLVPHPEGGRDPLKRFASALNDTDEDARDRFYARNFVELIGSRAA